MWGTILRGLGQFGKARLMQSPGLAGTLTNLYWGQPQELEQPTNRFWTYNEDEGIPGIDFPEQGQFLPYDQVYRNSLLNQKQSSSFLDLIFNVLMNSRR